MSSQNAEATGAFTYNLDLVLCIDVTGSMNKIIKDVKTNALNFHEALLSKMASKQKSVSQLRVRVIAFRDMMADNPCFIESKFFVLPEEKTEFFKFVELLKAKGGGGDGPESGLEAISLAITSDWVQSGNKVRHAIVVWTDARPHPLEKGLLSRPQGFETRLATSLTQLTDWWESPQDSMLRNEAKRLVIFAPDGPEWSQLVENWNQTIFYESKAGQGLKDFEFDTILDLLVQSI